MSISLVKGQKISLNKEGGEALSTVVMGLGWDAKKKKGFLGFGSRDQEIDLDASCVMFDASGNMLDVVWFRQLRSQDGSITHTGDNRTGAGDGDDEQIIVELPRVPQQVTSLVFVVNSFTGQNFSEIERAFCRIVDQKSGKEVARYDLSAGGPQTAQVMAKVYRNGAEWKMAALGEPSSGRTFQDLLPAMRANL